MSSKLRQGILSILEESPQIASEWNHELNGDLGPESVASRSTSKYWWKCSKGHNWQAAVANRTKRGDGCPICSGRVADKGVNDLATLRPDLVSFWHPDLNGSIGPSNVKPGSSYLAWWKCENGHEYQCRVNSRVRGITCGACSHAKKKQIGGNKVVVSPLSKLDDGRRALLITEFDSHKNGGFKIEQARSHGKYWWVCSKGHSYHAQFASRIRGTNCPYCSNQRVLKGFNDLATTHPDLAIQFDSQKNGCLPDSIIAGTGKVYWWKCSKGHSVQAKGDKRKRHGCGICSNKVLFSGFNDMATTHPLLAAEFDIERNGGLTPNDVIAGTSIELFWTCKFEHSYKTSGMYRVSQNRGCPICSNNKILPGFNDMATVEPRLVEHFHWEKNSPKTPQSISPRTNKLLWWKCDEGHEYQAKPGNRLQEGGFGCPICSTHQILKGFNDLPTTMPELASEWDHTKNTQLSLYEVAAGTNKKAWWKCRAGHSWYAYINLRSRGRACPRCSKGGFDNTKPGWLYLIENRNLLSRKFGISNHRTKRLLEYEQGWEAVAIWASGDGLLIRDLETAILGHIRKDLGLPTFLGAIEMGRAGGHSETFSIEGSSNQELIQKVWTLYEEMKSQEDELRIEFTLS